MAEITFVSTVKRVQAQAGFDVPAPTPSDPLPRVVAVLGVPGRPGRDGRDGANGDGSPVDPGDLTLLFDNKLIG